jgi:hypothetical protein
MRRAIDDAKIDRLLAIVVEAEQNSNRANFLLKSKAENFDGSMVGFGPSAEKICADLSAHYDALRESSGSEVWRKRWLRRCTPLSGAGRSHIFTRRVL